MELENIVANTVYIKARECGSDINKGRSKKWRKLLQFPHISLCLDLKDKIDCTHAFIVEHQPIGRLLFRAFCDTRPAYARCCSLLDAIESFEVQTQADPLTAAQDIIDRFLTPSAANAVDVLLSPQAPPPPQQPPSSASSPTSNQRSHDVVERCRERLRDPHAAKSRDLFCECTK